MNRILYREVASGAVGIRSAVRGEHCSAELRDIDTTFYCSRQAYHPGAHAAHEDRTHPVNPSETIEVIEVAWTPLPELVEGDGSLLGWEAKGPVIHD